MLPSWICPTYRTCIFLIICPHCSVVKSYRGSRARSRVGKRPCDRCGARDRRPLVGLAYNCLHSASKNGASSLLVAATFPLNGCARRDWGGEICENVTASTKR